MNLPFNKEYPEFLGSISIDINLEAKVVMDDMSATVQLDNIGEAIDLVKEFEDTDGTLCYNDNAVMSKYPELHQFRP